MKIPKTTEEKPYIEFTFNKQGKLSLNITSNWWSGKNGGFISSDGTFGNSCKPNQLNSYIEAQKKRQIKEVEQEIKQLQKKIEKLKQNLVNTLFNKNKYI